MVITYCDKHADQFVLMCTKLYAIHAWEHIDGASGTYRKIDDEDEKTVVARLADIVQDVLEDVVWFVSDEEGRREDAPGMHAHDPAGAKTKYTKQTYNRCFLIRSSSSSHPSP